MKVAGDQYKHQYAMIIDDEELDNFLNEKLIRFNHFSKFLYKHNSAGGALKFLNDLARQGDAGKQIFPEVIFIDLNMPVMDGFEFLELLSQTIYSNKIHTKLVVLTSSVSQKDQERVMAMSPDYLFTTKPLSGEYLNSLPI